jgi:thiol-disulfide isomerase/thioredoxin
MMIFHRTAALFLLLAIAVSGAARASVPDFTTTTRQAVAALPVVNGTSAQVTVDSLRDKPVLVTFFASWCPPCLEEFDHLNKLAQKYQATDLRIVAINVYEAWDDNDTTRMQQFINRTRPQFPAVTGSEEIRTLFGGIDRIPTVYGFNRQGQLTYQFVHQRGSTVTNATLDELDLAARELLGHR